MGNYFLAHETMFWRMAKGMGVIYLIALFAILPFATRSNSGQGVAAILQQQSQPDTVVVTYGIRYPVSIAYYSDLRPARLMQTEADIEKVRPHKMSWTATNIMPFAAVEDMDLQKDTLLVTDSEHAGELGTKVPGFWQEVGSSHDYIVYRLKPDIPYNGHVELPGRKNDTFYGILEQYLLGAQTSKLQDS